MFHTFHKANKKPTKVLRRRAAPGCQACQQNRVWILLHFFTGWTCQNFTFELSANENSKISCSRQRPRCQECEQSKTTCFYTTSSSRHAFKLQSALARKSTSHTETFSYALGEGSLSPGSNTDSIDSGISMASSATLDSKIGMFEASTTNFMDDNFFFSDELKAHDADALWLDMSTLDKSSPQMSERPPSSPECLAVQSYPTSLSAAPNALQISAGNAPQTDCYHGEMIERLLGEVMGNMWPASSRPASPTDTLSALRNALNRLIVLSECAICVSSCKSMSLVLVIIKAALGHITSLVDRTSTFDKVTMHLGSYSADSAEECSFIYTQIMRRHVMKLADLADSFARDAQRAGWLAHVLSLKDVAEEARTLAEPDFGII